MSVEELITELQKYPPHFEVECWWEGIELDDTFARPVAVTNENSKTEKIVLLEMDAAPRP